MVKRPYSDQNESRGSRRRRDASAVAVEESAETALQSDDLFRNEPLGTGIQASDESEGEENSNQSNTPNNIGTLPSPSLETSNRVSNDEDVRKVVPIEADVDFIDGDESDGSGEGSSVGNPEDDFISHSPSGPSRNMTDLEVSMYDQEALSSGDENDGVDLEDRDPPLYFGAPITLNESMLSVLALTFTHNLSKSCLNDVLQLISIHCPPTNLCKDNIRLFKKHFAKSKSLVVRHYYCTTCFDSLKDKSDICGQCNKHRGAAFFVEVPILAQLEALYSRVGFHRLLMHRMNRSKIGVNSYDDIYDGRIYKSLCTRGNILSDPNNISFSWHCSGLGLGKTSGSEMWPFYLTVNELPFAERHKPENVLLAGIWFGAHKPVPHLFLKGIREDFHSLNKGVQFKVPDNPEPILVRGVVACGSSDLESRALFLNMSHPNSSFGCTRCKIRSVKVNNQVVYPFQRYPQTRTYEETLEHAGKALRNRRSVYGVKGISALSFAFKPVETAAIDMHNAYLGIAKILNKVHFGEEHHQHPASLFGFLPLYDRRLCAIKPPYYVEKLPRSFSAFGKEWGAAELKVNLMIYSLPLLQDIMSAFHFEHHMLLVYGLYILSKDSVSEQDVALASEMLTDYCSRFEDLYGRAFMSLPVHQLIHLPSVVKDFGPLWVTSCAPFEGLNETLRRFSLGNNQEEMQVTSTASLFLHVSKFKPVQPNIGRPAHAFCEKLSLSRGGHKLEVHSIYGNFCVVGKMQRSPVLPEVVYVAIGPLKLSGRNYCVFSRILNIRRNVLFSSMTFDKGLKNLSSCVKYQKNNGSFFGRVHSYLRVTNCQCNEVCLNCDANFFAIIQRLHVQPAYRAEPGGFIPFIHRCAEMNEYEAVRVECLMYVCFLIEIEDRHDAFVVEPITTGQIE